MVAVAQGDIWWVELPPPRGSEPGFRRPVVVVQGQALNASRLGTVVCVPLTSNLRWAEAPGNVALPADATGLPKDAVAVGAHILSLDRRDLAERAGILPPRLLEAVLDGIDIVLGH